MVARPPAVVRREFVTRNSVPWTAIGQSTRGAEIEALRFGSGPLRVLIIGSIHGDEPEGVDLVERLAVDLSNESGLLADATVLLVRNANPDGTATRTRTNSNGVDLNRNFPARNWKAIAKSKTGTSGSEPGTEPETQAILKMLDEFEPHRIVAIHSTRGKPMVNYDGPALELARAMSRHNRYVPSETIGYPTPGSLGSYAGIDLKIPIITLELPRGIAPDLAWKENREALLQSLR